MTTVTYCSRPANRGRAAFCATIAQNGEVHKFAGASIPGVVRVDHAEYKKDGKWSGTTYSLSLAQGARAISGHDDFANCTLEGGVAVALGLEPSAVSTWAALAASMGADHASVEAWVRALSPKAAARLDAASAPI